MSLRLTFLPNCDEVRLPFKGGFLRFGLAALVASTISITPFAAVRAEEASFGLRGARQVNVAAEDAEMVTEFVPSSRRKVDLHVRLFLNGHMASSSRILANLNQRTRITHRDVPDRQAAKEYVLEILPELKSVKKTEMVQMNFRIGTKEHGAIQWLASSKVVNRNNEEAAVDFKFKNRKYKKLHFRVTPEIVE